MRAPLYIGGKSHKKKKKDCPLCKHDFKSHSPICEEKNCLCLRSDAMDAQLMILERGTTNKEIGGIRGIFLPKSVSVFREKHRHGEYTSLNHWLFWNSEKILKQWPVPGWTCIKCGQFGTWAEMREHGHNEEMVRVIQKK